MLNGEPLTVDDVVAVARGGRRVALGGEAAARVRAARTLVEQVVAHSRPVYGITTGFGALSRVTIPQRELSDLQRNLIRSHAAGVGAPLSADVVRAMMLVAAASLARGASGARPELIAALLDLLNHDITPHIPSRGSVGASGDLAPLAHMALVLIGEGEVLTPGGGRAPASEALAVAGLRPLPLEAKEGLALINGTHLMAGSACLLLHDSWQLLHAAEVAAAMSLDGALGTHTPLDPRIHALRRQPGQQDTAARLRALLDGSALPASHRDDPRVQDPYTLRCIPQVLGAARDTLAYIGQVVAAELGAVTDNPLLFPDDNAILSGGNFHGQPLATVLDLLTIAVAQIAGFAERRTFLLLSAWEPEMHLPPFLTPQPGLQSGLMVAQYTAAALVVEIRALAQPASVGSLPTSGGMEDWNSMGATAALQALQAIEMARGVVAIELLCAAQSLDQHRPLRSGRGVEAAHARIRAAVPPLHADHPPAPDIEAISRLIGEGAFDDVQSQL